jgi:DNA-directed RNA polymerase subunit alpha
MAQPETAALKARIVDSKEFGRDEIAGLRGELSRAGGGQMLREIAQELEQRINQADQSESKLLAVRLGVVYYLLGRNERAITHLQQRQDDPVASYYLGVAQMGRGSYDAAASSFELAGQHGYDSQEATLARAGALRARGKREEALRLLDGLEGKATESAEYLYQRGCCLADDGDVQEATELLVQAVEKDPRHAGALFALAYLNDRHGNDEVAIEFYERAASQTPAHAGSLLNLGILYEDKGRFGQAARCYNRILDVYPDHPRARLFLRDTRASRSMYYDEDAERSMSRFSQVLDIPVTDFELSVRSRNCLAKMNIFTLGHLTRTTEEELLASKNFGETSLEEIKEILASKGLRLGQALEQDGDRDFGREPEELSPKEVAILSKPISELNLSVRARKCTTKLNINTIGDLVSRSGDELLECKNFGVTSLNEVREKLRDLNLKLRGD